MDKIIQSNYYNSSQTLHGSMSNVMGSRCDIVMVGEDREKAEYVWKTITDELGRLSCMLNRFDAESELANLNRRASNGQEVKVDDEIWSIMQDCRQYYLRTNKLFDVTLHDFTKVIFDDEVRSISFASRDIHIDLGGYAKGYALRKIGNVLHENDVKRCLVDFGNSSIMAIGSHPYGDSWRISVEDPFEEKKVVGKFDLLDLALSVSGNTPKYAGHIIRPNSGKYNYEKKLVCVVSRDPLDADVLTTTLVVASSEERVRILKRFEIELFEEIYL